MYWSERATFDELRLSSSVMLRQELARLYAAVEQVDDHLADPTRAERFPSRREYDEWATKAGQARTFKTCAISRVEAVLDERGEPMASRDAVTAVNELLGMLGHVKWHPEEDKDILTAMESVHNLISKGKK